MNRAKAKALILISITIAAIDGALKYFAITRLPEEGGRVSFPIDFLLHKNPGIAFDTVIPMPIIITLTLVIVVIIGKFGIKEWKKHPERSLAAAMILSGAFGNMIDRLINNFTTDYIIILGRSAINLSDILIISGTILILWYGERRGTEKQVNTASQTPPN